MIFEPLWHSLKNLNNQIENEEEKQVQTALFVGSLPTYFILGILCILAKIIDMVVLGVVALCINVAMFCSFLPVSPFRHTPILFHYYILDTLFIFSRLWRRKEISHRVIRFPRPEYTGVASMNTAMLRTALLTYSFRTSNGSKLCSPSMVFLTIWLIVLRFVDVLVTLLIVVLVMAFFMVFTLSAIVSACTDKPLDFNKFFVTLSAKVVFIKSFFFFVIYLFIFY